jgi:hypothetical protein
MKTIFCLILCLLAILSSVSVALHPAAAQKVTADPLISLTVHNEPLGDVLASLTRDTGYRFNLNRKWRTHPVSATIGNLTLEQGLKRLLRSLNHTIIWEADKPSPSWCLEKPTPADPVLPFHLKRPPERTGKPNRP